MSLHGATNSAYYKDYLTIEMEMTITIYIIIKKQEKLSTNQLVKKKKKQERENRILHK